jgi:hypothetical protein
MTRRYTLSTAHDCMAISMCLSLFFLALQLIFLNFPFVVIHFVFICCEALFGVSFVVASCAACGVSCAADPELAELPHTSIADDQMHAVIEELL